MINKKFMKDRRYKNVLITYQGESDEDKGTAIFYVKNKKDENAGIGTIRWDKELEVYDVERGDLKEFDASCRANIIEFLDELNKSVK